MNTSTEPALAGSNSNGNGNGRAPESRKKLFALALGSVGVVYGDIGTSPLYAMRESLKVVAGDGLERGEVLGIVSLLLWSLTLIVTIKYVIFLLRADNHGEGGILSLLTLVRAGTGRKAAILTMTAIIGAALFAGDAMITPAISVLSAVEGLKLVAPGFDAYIIPITVVILIGLFTVQSGGTEKIGRWFGPITAVWFFVMGAAGVWHIADDPGIMLSFNPLYAGRFLVDHKAVGFIVLGAVFLAVTGAEALYADLGHFGRRPIQWAWIVLVLPALVLNYLGQGAMVLHAPEKLENAFFLMFPDWALIPIVILATMATVIASQATISGAYSLTRQAVQMGFLPRMLILHTSEEQTGQITIPAVTKMLLVGVILLVLVFENSSALAAAYGISVSGTMIVTTLLFYQLIRHRWNWPLWGIALFIVPLTTIEAIFFVSNLTKFFQGGYVPILVALIIAVVMWTWIKGTAIFAAKTHKSDLPLATFIGMVERESDHSPVKVPGTAMFMTSDTSLTPSALLHNLKHNHVLHEQNVVLAVRSSELPTVGAADRMKIVQLSERFWTVEFNFGYMETPNVSKALNLCRKAGLKFDIMATSFYLGRRKLVRDPKSALPGLLNKLFISMAKGAVDPTDFFHLPANRVVEMGAHVSV